MNEKTKSAMSVLIISQMPVVREMLRELMEAQPGVASVRAVEDPDSGIGLIDASAPEMVVIDLQLTLQRSIDAVRRMLAINPRLKIIVLSMHSDCRYLDACLKSGVCGYILKDYAYEELADAAAAVAADRQYVSKSIRISHLLPSA